MGPACSDHRCEGWDGADQLSPGWMAVDLRAGWVVEPGARGGGRACALSIGSRPLATQHHSAEDCRPREQEGHERRNEEEEKRGARWTRFLKCHPQSPPIGQGAHRAREATALLSAAAALRFPHTAVRTRTPTYRQRQSSSPYVQETTRKPCERSILASQASRR